MNTPDWWHPFRRSTKSQKLNVTAMSGWLIIGLASLFVVFLLIVPIIALLWRTVPGLMAGIWQTPTILAALRLSLLTSTLTTLIAILFGTPLAYFLARYQIPGGTLLDVLIDLPMVLPPAVAGVALLVAFGRNGLVGQWLALIGLEIPFTMMAVVIAQTFVAAPFYIRAAKVGFAEVDFRLEQISATLGESNWGTFWRVTLPLARNSLLGGAIMSWARALGEFGATILFAGNLSGRTQTMPLAIYSALQSDVNVALALAAILLGTSFGLMILLRLITR